MKDSRTKKKCKYKTTLSQSDQIQNIYQPRPWIKALDIRFYGPETEEDHVCILIMIVLNFDISYFCNTRKFLPLHNFNYSVILFFVISISPMVYFCKNEST